jgi:inositol phosphorylceramide synthase catalytic subunit
MKSGTMTEFASWKKIAPLLFGGHLAILTALQGVNIEYLVVDGFFLALSLCGAKTRQFAWLGLPVWIAAVVYANILPLLLPFRGPVHVADLYAAELHWFGVPGPHGRETLCEFFRDHHWAVMDVICGLVYMCYLLEPLPFGIYLFLKDQRRLARLAWVFAIVHIANFVTYVFYPAAPPWYVEQYGLGPALDNVSSSAAGFARFDELFGINLVHGFYNHSHNVFGAMPSGHVGSAVLFAILAWGMGRRWFVPAAVFAALMAFGAVYFQHHYVLDVIGGCVYATLGYGLVTAVETWCVGAQQTAYRRVPSSLGEAHC